jgi:hypothetical protein
LLHIFLENVVLLVEKRVHLHGHFVLVNLGIPVAFDLPLTKLRRDSLIFKLDNALNLTAAIQRLGNPVLELVEAYGILFLH